MPRSPRSRPWRAVIAAVIDKSGSMQRLATDVIGGFNRFLADQQAVSGEAIMSVVLFDTEVVHLRGARDDRALRRRRSRDQSP